MLSPAIHARRRQRLQGLVSAPVLLMGNGVRSRNLPAYGLPFRQDSTFWYFTGCALPNAAAVLMDGRCTLFLPRPADDDALWHGHVETFDHFRERYGVDAVRAIEELPAALTGLQALTLAVPDEESNRLAERLTGRAVRFGSAPGDEVLIDAVIALRRPKEPEEIDAMRRAAAATDAAFRAVIAGTRPGGTEHGLAVLFQSVLAMRGCTEGYGTILTQNGEVLHSHDHGQGLDSGRLVLLDGGGEVLANGYGVDVTRVWPVNGRFDARQKAAYEAVLAAQLASIERCREGVRNRAVHDASCLVLARWLADEKLLKVSPEAAVEAGAHAVFFPHGVGHLLGMDVHDLENFGDRPAYPKGAKRPEPFGTRYLRLDLPLEPGWVITIEPGFYVAPAILHDRALRERFRDLVDYDRAESWIGFGGIRIEDDVLITQGEPDVITRAIPKTVQDVEALVGSGPTPEERLC